MLKGEGEVGISGDDYIIAALMIYVDIITIFIQIVALFSEANSD